MHQRFFFLLMTIYCFNSCKKEESSDPNKDKMNLLTSKTWKISLADDHPESNPSGTILYYAPQQCELDDSYNFGNNNQVTFKSGELKCNTDEENTSIIDYSIDFDAKKFILGTITYKLEEISATQMKFSAPVPYGSNSSATIILLLKH